jgi:hypothetical protein
VFHSRRYQIFWEVGGLERGTIILLSKIELIIEWKNSGSGLKKKIEINGRGNSLRWPRNTPSIRRELALTSPTSGGRSVDTVRLRTKTTEFLLTLVNHWHHIKSNQLPLNRHGIQGDVRLTTSRLMLHDKTGSAIFFSLDKKMPTHSTFSETRVLDESRCPTILQPPHSLASFKLSSTLK